MSIESSLDIAACMDKLRASADEAWKECDRLAAKLAEYEEMIGELQQELDALKARLRGQALAKKYMTDRNLTSERLNHPLMPDVKPMTLGDYSTCEIYLPGPERASIRLALKERDRLAMGLEELSLDLLEALDTLRELHDHQNGPPLVKYEKRWQAAMDRAIAILKRHGV